MVGNDCDLGLLQLAEKTVAISIPLLKIETIL